MKIRTMLIAAAVAAVAAYWHWSPYLAMRELRAAAQAGDGDRMAEFVDFESLQTSLKAQLKLKAAESMGSSKPESGAAAAGAALGAALGAVLIDRAIDAMVTPHAVRQMVARGSLKKAEGEGQGQAQGPGVKWTYERPALGTLIAFPRDQARLAPPARDRFVFKRSGFADWKLTEIRMSGTS
jgi:DNA-binding transcriptional regulator YdaS (Cro superfamily)